ncbi:MAG: ABC transporter substrate-binding protein [Puniceicoccales bacterium]
MSGLKTALILAAIAVVVGLPFVFQRSETTIGRSEDVVVVITPHNEAIRHEFETAFRKWYRDKTGRTVDVDWRVIGGTNEIVRYLNSEFENSFRNHWTGTHQGQWTPEVWQGYSDGDLILPDDPEADGPAEAARRAFLDSNVSVGVDVFFGGGSYDFIKQAEIGTLVPWRDASALAERFPEEVFPQQFAGEVFWDPEGRWIGAVLSSFGIIYNVNSLERLGIGNAPTSWHDLADPRLFGEVALADPTKSGSITKAFEMIVQEEMDALVDQALADGLSPEEAEAQGVPAGWMDAMQWIQKICANARYFTDSATKGPVDVASGDCAMGMSIDFYGRFQSEVIVARGGGDRLRFVAPEGASTLSADPIGILRGAPNANVADLFVEFVLSEEGQRLWGYRVGVEGGPVEYALRRSPVLRPIYEGDSRLLLSEPDVNPYENVRDFLYRPEWTGRLFTPLRFLIRVAFIDSHDELAEAWGAILHARERGDRVAAEAAESVFSDLSAIRFEVAAGEIAQILRSGDKIEEVRLSRTLAQSFRRQYVRAKKIAEGQLPPSEAGRAH